jgi:hypothetical protein
VLIDTDKGYGLSLGTRACGATNSVDIIFRNVRKIKIDHMWKFRNIDAASRYVRSDKNMKRAGLELRKGMSPRSLTLVAMNCKGRDPIFIQLLRQTVGSMFRPRKNQDLKPFMLLDQF